MNHPLTITLASSTNTCVHIHKTFLNMLLQRYLKQQLKNFERFFQTFYEKIFKIIHSSLECLMNAKFQKNVTKSSFMRFVVNQHHGDQTIKIFGSKSLTLFVRQTILGHYNKVFKVMKWPSLEKERVIPTQKRFQDTISIILKRILYNFSEFILLSLFLS